MNRFAKIIPLLLSALIAFSCNNKKEASPYNDILQQQPFASLTDSIQKDPNNDGLRFRRAVLLNKNNFPEPALADIRKAWSLKKDERYALAVSTILLNKNTDSAIFFLQEALKELPGNILLQLSLAHAYDAQDRTDDAMKICDAILNRNPEQVDVLKMKADLLDKKKDPGAAIEILEKAYSLTPFDVDLNYSLAFKYAENKNIKVVSLCDSLIAKDSLKRHAEPYYYKGIFYSNIDDNAKALSMFEQAIQHNYYFLNAYIEKGRVQYDQKKFADALKTFELANTISPKFPDAWYWMGKSQEAMGRKADAKLNYLKAYGLDQTFTEAKDAADRIIK
jgi:tetratricopeptide (TPR) repeat protein